MVERADIEVGGRAGRKQGKATAAERYDGEIVRQVEMGRDLSRVAQPDARGRAFHQRKGVLGGEAGQEEVRSGRAGIDGDRAGPNRGLPENLVEARDEGAGALGIHTAHTGGRADNADARSVTKADGSAVE